MEFKEVNVKIVELGTKSRTKQLTLESLLTGLPISPSKVKKWDSTLHKSHEVEIGTYPLDIANSIVGKINDVRGTTSNLMAFTVDNTTNGGR